MASENYFKNLAQVESGGNQASQARKSSAYGLYQFTKGTWKSLIDSHPELGLTEKDRENTDAQHKAIRALTDDNAAALKSHGHEPTDQNLYMAHFLGAGDAPKFLSAHAADPSTLAANVVQSESVAKNKDVFYHKGDDGQPDTNRPKTVGEIYANFGEKFGAESGSPQTTDATAPATATTAAPAPAVTPAANAPAASQPADPLSTTPQYGSKSQPGASASGPTPVMPNWLEIGAAALRGEDTDKYLPPEYRSRKQQLAARGYADGGRVADTREYMAGVDPYADLPPPVPERANRPTPPLPERANRPETPAPPLPERAYVPAGTPPPTPEKAHLPIGTLPPILAKDEEFSKLWKTIHHNPTLIPYPDLVKAYNMVVNLAKSSAGSQSTLTPTDLTSEEVTTTPKVSGPEAFSGKQAYIPQAEHEPPGLWTKAKSALGFGPTKSQDYIPYEYEDGQGLSRNMRPASQGFSRGGGVSSDKAKDKDRTVSGFISSDTTGTSDKLPFKVREDSYVIPADVVSGMGKGNSNAGAKMLDSLYKSRISVRAKKDLVPVKLSGGEYVISPESVHRAGGGHLGKGLDHFDSIISRVRQRTIKELRNKKAPIR